MKKKETSPYAFLRCFYALPTPMSIDVYLDDVIFCKDMLCEDFSDYKSVNAVQYTLSITKHNTTEVLATRELYLSKERIYTLIIAPDLKSTAPGLYLINDVQRPIKENHCMVRIGSFSTLENNCSVSLKENTKTFKKIVPHQPSHYIAFEPQNYMLEVQNIDNPKITFAHPSTLLKPSRLYTFYLIGNQTKAFPLKLVLSIDGNSFLSFSPK